MINKWNFPYFGYPQMLPTPSTFNFYSPLQPQLPVTYQGFVCPIPASKLESQKQQNDCRGKEEGRSDEVRVVAKRKYTKRRIFQRKEFVCPENDCKGRYASKTALNKHIRDKHIEQ